MRAEAPDQREGEEAEGDRRDLRAQEGPHHHPRAQDQGGPDQVSGEPALQVRLRLRREHHQRARIQVSELQSRFHTIWADIIGHMDLGPNPNRFIYMNFVSISSDLCLFQ